MSKFPDFRTSHTDLVPLYLEYRAIRKFVAHNRDDVMEQQYPTVAALMEDALDQIAALDSQHWATVALNKLIRGEFDSMAEMYDAIRLKGQSEDGVDVLSYVLEHDEPDAVVAPREAPAAVKEPFVRTNKNEKIKSVKRGRKNLSREVHQRKKQGAGFIDDPKLVSYAKTTVTDLCKSSADVTEDDIRSLAQDVVAAFPEVNLTDEQQQVLMNEIMLPLFNSLTQHDRTERLFLDMGNNTGKSLFYLWHNIKRHCAVSENLTVSQSNGKKWAACNPEKLNEYLKLLEKHGCIQVVKWGQKHLTKRVATVVKRVL